MFILQLFKRNLYLIISVMILVSFMAIPLVYSDDSDNNRYREDTSSVFAPGYLNAAKYQAEAIVNQQTQPRKSLLQNMLDYVQGKTENTVQQDAVDKPIPVLQQKQSSAKSPANKTIAQMLKNQASSATQTEIITSSLNYSVNIGSGTDQVYDANGKVYAEKINGVLTIYAGFDSSLATMLPDGNINASVIQDAINFASANGGGMVLVKGGEYDSMSTLNLGGNVKLYGGYNQDGVRDIVNASTIVNDTSYNTPNCLYSQNPMFSVTNDNVEINGFTLNGQYTNGVYGYFDNAITISSGVSNTRILNNTITKFYYSFIPMTAFASFSYDTIFYNNDVSNCMTGVWGDSYGGIFSNNKIHDNGEGINICWGTSEGYFINNVLWNNDINIFVTPGDNTGSGGPPTFVGNTIYGTGNLFKSGNSAILQDNLFVSSEFGDAPGVSWMAGYYSVSGLAMSGNAFYADNSTIGIDPSQGIYTSSLVDIGYSPNNVTTDYNTISPVTYTMTATNTPSNNDSPNVVSLNNLSNNQIANAYYNNYAEEHDQFSNITQTHNTNELSLVYILKNAFKETPDNLLEDATVSALGQKLTNPGLVQSSLLQPQGQVYIEDVNAAMNLASILHSPSEDQKAILDVIKALLVDTDKTEKESGKNVNPELKKATNDLLQAVANILLTQAVPGLLKEGDMSNIKGIFQELDTQKNKIMLDYAISTKPYYDNMLKDLAKNMAMLQGKNLLNPNMTKDELTKLPPSELDKILEKIKNMKDKTFEEEYILQQEAKYRQTYLDPNKKKLESDMKDTLNSFTSRLNDVLKTTDKK